MQVSSNLISAPLYTPVRQSTSAISRVSVSSTTETPQTRHTSVTYIKKFHEYDRQSQLALNAYSEIETFAENGVGILAGISVYI